MIRRDSIGRQAAIRLFVSLGLLVALIAAGSVGIYQVALEKAAHKRAEELVGFYTTRLGQVEQEWEIRSRDFKVRIEITRALEDPATAASNLQAFMTIQGADRPFQYLLIQTEGGKKLFDFGRDIVLPSIPASAEAGLGHYLDPKNGQIYRIFEHPIWLGEEHGMGRFAVFFRIDNALLRQLSTPGLTLSALHEGKPVASSGGQAALDHLRSGQSLSAADKDIRELPWTGEVGAPLRLLIEAPVTTLFSTAELSVGMSMIPLVDGLVLWLTIGLWLTRQTGRITHLGRAVGEYATSQHTTKAMATMLASARQGQKDEISEVADAMEVFAAAIDKREGERAESAELLRASELRFRQLFNAGSDAIFVAEVLPGGRPGNFVEVNEIACQRLGYTREELMRMSPDDVDAPEHGNASDPVFLRKLHENGQAIIERVHVAKDGRYIPVEVNVHLFTLGGRDAILGVARDISERKQSEAALREAKNEAERASHAKSEFLAHMSHEIRTPMNAIVGAARLMESESLSPRQMSYAQIMRHSSRSLLTLIHNILDLSKIEAGIELDIETFDLVQIIDGLTGVAAALAQDKEIAFKFDLAPDLPPRLMGDAYRLEQVLNNLLTNAIKFTAQGEITLCVQKISEDVKSVRLLFALSDTGVGISSDKLGAIFEPFVQAESTITRTHGGTGLGLAISRRLVELMGGAIEVESAPGLGSRFAFTVAFELPPAAEAASLQAGLTGQRIECDDFPSSGYPLAGRRVLMVEDNQFNRVVLEGMLQRFGIEVDEAVDGCDGVERFKASGPYDAILMDLHLPGLDGFDCTRAIRALPEGAQVPIIAYTANVLTTTGGKCLAAGMNGCLTKPVEPEILLRTLMHWILGEGSSAPARAAPAVEDRADLLPDALPGIDRAKALAFSSSACDLAKLLDHTFIHCGNDPVKLSQHIIAGDTEAAAGITHNLMAVASMVGAITLFDAARQLNHELRAGSMGSALAQEAIESIVTEFARLNKAREILQPWLD
jgi:PAS domain S-box-containing protein